MRVSKTHMLQETMNVSGPDRTQKIRVGVPKMPMSAGGAGQKPAGPKPTFTKVFRWRLPDGQKPEPATVEIVGTFTNWQKVPLLYDRVQGAWQVMLQHTRRQPHTSLYAAGGRKAGPRPALRRSGHSAGPVEEPYAHGHRPRPRHSGLKWTRLRCILAAMNHLVQARKVFDIELAALKAVRAQLDASFDRRGGNDRGRAGATRQNRRRRHRQIRQRRPENRRHAHQHRFRRASCSTAWTRCTATSASSTTAT
jgi:hypothetical protein